MSASLRFSSAVTSFTTLATVLESIAPRLSESQPAHIRWVANKSVGYTYCFDGGRLVVIASGGWIGSYASLHCRS